VTGVLPASADVAAALADAQPSVLWLDRPERPEPLPALDGDAECDLLIVGGGFTGLWAALAAKQRDPQREIVLVEAETVAFGGSGRNGGFCVASLTHGLPNGIERFPGEIERLEQLGRDNLAGLRADVERLGIDCGLEAGGGLDVATEPYQVAEHREYAELLRRYGHDATFLDREAVRAEVASPTYLAATWYRDGIVMLDPARLAWGLRAAALAAGVRIHEHTPVLELEPETARCPGGTVRARRVLLAAGVFRPLVKAIRRYAVPVYDYVLATEPLSPAQLDSIGWRHRQGIGDSANQFHYYRLTQDNRIVWGGYDAVYYYGNAIRPQLDQRPATFETLARNFLTTFPQLRGIRFTHRWGGVIDTCSRFSVMFGTAHRGRVAYAVGYTGLGVGATRFGARVALDLLDDPSSELLKLQMVRTKPLPFPPEPLRWAGITLTRRALARADRRAGRRGPWLRTLDRLGLGFDS
jgi:glycine/D-amino acid oxidase-like deaminating enzyme